MAQPLTKERRESLPESDFAVPGKRALPMHDETHVRLAWDMVDRTKGLTPDERKTARARIKRRAHQLGVDTTNWKGVNADYESERLETSVSASRSVQLQAMALEFPDDSEHPNKMPFSGILTRVDEPSDNPPTSEDGPAKRTYIPAKVAEAALPSLLGMGVDFSPNLDAHDKTAKIGIITEADIVGNAISISGFFYAADFPEICARIKREKTLLGFSYECQARIHDENADPWVITQCVFTGAAVLYKHKAAYTTTSLSASAAVGEIEMNPDELKALIANAVAEAVKPLQAKLDASEQKAIEAAAVRDKVTVHANAIRSCAAAMEAAGIGTHATQGHVNVLRHMAASMEAEATMGNLPHIYRDHDYLSRTMEAGADQKAIAAAVEAAVKPLTEKLAAAETKVTDLQAAAFKNADQPERKTLTPEIKQLLAKAGIGEDDATSGKVTAANVDKFLDAAGIRGTNAIATKLRLHASGVLAATAQ